MSKKKLIWLDAGHGGSDPGAVGPSGLRESDVVLAVCLRAKRLLESLGFKVGFTREIDKFVALSNRSYLANTAGADVFVSVHCNSATREDASGIETFSMRGSEKGGRLAECLQDEMLENFPSRVDRGVKESGFSVLRKTRMPAALMELEFIHNGEGEAHFSKDQTLDASAAALADGVAAYFEMAGLPELHDITGELGKVSVPVKVSNPLNIELERLRNEVDGLRVQNASLKAKLDHVRKVVAL